MPAGILLQRGQIKEPATRECSECQQLFTPTTHNQQACPDCKRARRLRVMRNRCRDWRRKNYARAVHRPAKGATTERTCLKCDRPFESEGPGNRLCPACQNTARERARVSQIIEHWTW